MIKDDKTGLTETIKWWKMLKENLMAQDNKTENIQMMKKRKDNMAA